MVQSKESFSILKLCSVLTLTVSDLNRIRPNSSAVFYIAS